MEEEFLICQPVQQALAVILGSVQGECNDCGTSVWIAPSGQKLIRERRFTILCSTCALTRMAKEPGPHEIRVTPEAAQEIEAWRSRN